MSQWLKNPPTNAGDVGLFPGSGRSSGGGNGNPLQYSCLGNPMDRGGWWATVHEVSKLGTVEHAHNSVNTYRHTYFMHICMWRGSTVGTALLIDLAWC